MIDFKEYLNKGFCEFIDKFLINQLNVITENQIYNLIEEYSEFKYPAEILIKNIKELKLENWIEEELFSELNEKIILKFKIDINNKFKYNDIELYNIQEKLEKKYSKKQYIIILIKNI